MKKMYRLLSLLLILTLCLSLAGTAGASSLSKYASLANSSAQYSTTQQFIDALDENDVPYEYGGMTDADDEKVYIDFPGDNCEDIFITAFFGPDEDDVYFRIWNLIDFNSSDYRELLGKINDLNDDYNFVTFLLDASDYSVTVKLDALLPADCGDMCLQYMLLLGNIADAGYPVLLPYAIQ